MLLSPGNSPRHISSEKTLVTAAETTQSSSSNSLPSNSNPRRKRSPEVLDEDTYIAALERIVERDFFPDQPKLRDRLDWLEAVRSGDPVHIESTYCSSLYRHCETIRRTMHIVNLDPTAESFDYPVAMDIRELICLDDVMEELGSRGHCTFNFIWIQRTLH